MNNQYRFKKTKENIDTSFLQKRGNKIGTSNQHDVSGTQAMFGGRTLDLFQMQKAIGNMAVAQLVKEEQQEKESVLQRKVTLRENNTVYSSHYNNLDELEKLVRENLVEPGVYDKLEPTIIEQTLTRFDFQNRSFSTISALVSAVIKEVNQTIRGSSASVEENAQTIPKYLHHFWAGGSLSKAALTNLFHWLAKAKDNGWEQYIMTDSIINANSMFEGSKLNHQLEMLGASGATIVDMAQLPLNTGYDERDNPVSKAYHHLRDKLFLQEGKSKLPYISDLARYVQLFNLGGVYADVDISPGQVDLSRSLQMPEETGRVPYLGPGFRTEDDARRKGLFSEEPGKKEAALLGSFLNEYAIGNHFIGTTPRNPIISSTADVLSKNILESGVSNGGIDVMKGMRNSGLDLSESIAQSIPPWLMDVNWVTEESSSIVD
ncbi:glycosyltransferase [Bacillus horti]|uniref:Uncharacterized protein n=1 Tax=Caldalkalibacillus horti TaxID=77523 RepID=A0ABT9W3W0_9BACI|nr:glycosyltransferase [Bacillus horti]MDQ0167938.1 hypothetical protein [Bacillus horti]